MTLKILNLFAGIYKTNTDKKKILRNCVEPEMGLHVFNCAFKSRQVTLGDLDETEDEIRNNKDEQTSD